MSGLPAPPASLSPLLINRSELTLNWHFLTSPSPCPHPARGGPYTPSVSVNLISLHPAASFSGGSQAAALTLAKALCAVQDLTPGRTEAAGWVCCRAGVFSGCLCTPTFPCIHAWKFPPERDQRGCVERGCDDKYGRSVS